ncbi:hypothetical protein PM082_010718 [Marasmius tenuissimus]|nr:hypothetical protein PM082_010718 [Marasmius tenuissimus]
MILILILSYLNFCHNTDLPMASLLTGCRLACLPWFCLCLLNKMIGHLSVLIMSYQPKPNCWLVISLNSKYCSNCNRSARLNWNWNSYTFLNVQQDCKKRGTIKDSSTTIYSYQYHLYITSEKHEANASKPQKQTKTVNQKGTHCEGQDTRQLKIVSEISSINENEQEGR